MSTYLVPSDPDMIEDIARAIAKNRMHRDADSELKATFGIPLDGSEALEATFDGVFEELWGGMHPDDDAQRRAYREDAKTAIRVINMKLMIAL